MKYKVEKLISLIESLQNSIDEDIMYLYANKISKFCTNQLYYQESLGKIELDIYYSLMDINHLFDEEIKPTIKLDELDKIKQLLITLNLSS